MDDDQVGDDKMEDEKMDGDDDDELPALAAVVEEGEDRGVGGVV